MSIIIGEMRDKIDILTTTFVKDDFGAETETWTSFTKVRASKKEISGTMMVNNNELFHSNKIEWTIYYRPLLTDKMRVSIGGKLYRILYIREIGYKQGLVLETELINN